MFSLMGCISNTSEPVEVQIGPAKNVRFNNPNLLSVKKKLLWKRLVGFRDYARKWKLVEVFVAFIEKTFPIACIVNCPHI